MNNIKIFIISSLVLLLGSCSLDEVPQGFLSTENFYKTQEDAESAIAAAYSSLPSFQNYNFGYLYSTMATTEEFTMIADIGRGEKDLDNLNQSGLSNESTKKVYIQNYALIERSNAVIENVPGTEMDEDYRNQIVGEAYFLRAWGHYVLVRLFGKVPIRTSVIKDYGSAGASVSSIGELYAQIISDLETSISLMDTEKRRARVNRVGAQGVLANVYLFMASAAESDLEGYDFVTASGEDYYAKAKNEAAKVVNNPEQNQYGFDQSYLSIFNPEIETSPELIFYVLSTKSSVGELNTISALTTPYCNENHFTVSAEHGGFTSIYGWQHLIVEEQFYNSFAENDTRKKAFFLTSVTVNGVQYTYPDAVMFNPFQAKYLSSGTAGDIANRYPIVRYTEVLLTYAEACGLSQEGLDALNQVRNRAKLTPYQVSDFSDNKSFRDAVIQERAWELCFEYNRLHDLRRSGKMKEVLVDQYGKTLNKNFYFFEIPYEEEIYNPDLYK